MSVDVVCAGAPFLDLVFRGLPRIPGPGEEVDATEQRRCQRGASSALHELPSRDPPLPVHPMRS